jgi:hypothetical protein
MNNAFEPYYLHHEIKEVYDRVIHCVQFIEQRKTMTRENIMTTTGSQKHATTKLFFSGGM